MEKKSFTKEEVQNLLAFLNRSQLNGNEAEVMVSLKNKIIELTDKTIVVEEKKPEK